MSIVVGGQRTRFIVDSLYLMVQEALAALGWMDVGREHDPIIFRDDPVGVDEEVPYNTIAFEDTISSDSEAEIGSLLTIDDITVFIDIYAESESLGRHLSGDVRDILRGKLPAVGRNAPVLDVYDFNQATPVPVFTCQLERIRTDRAHNWPQAWRKHWYSLTVHIMDEYTDENDA